LCEAKGRRAAVVDMASIDEAMLIDLCGASRLVCVAEQNNGYILQNLLKAQYKAQLKLRPNLLAINTLDAEGRPRFIHSGTYEELIEAFGLTPAAIAAAIERAIG
jgi:transketolase C-terminal domain/subunit